MSDVSQLERQSTVGRECGLAVVATAAQLGLVALVGRVMRQNPFHFWKTGLACAGVTLTAGGRCAHLSHVRGEISPELQEAWAKREKLQLDDLIVIHSGVVRQDIGPANRKEVKELNALIAASNDKALEGLELAEPDSIAARAVYYLARPASVSFVVATEVLSIVSIGLSYLTLKRDRSPETPNPDQPPIILVHGRSSNEAQWPLTRPLLKKWGYENVYSLNLDDRKVGPPTNTFAEYEKRLEALIDKALADTGQKKVILIGHSMGGLLSVRAAKTGKVQAAMTIGSPLAGTDILTYKTELGLPIRDCDHAMLPGSTEALEAQALLKGDKARFYTIAMREDCVVFSRDHLTALQPSGDPRRQHILDHAGHIGAVLSPVTHHKLHGWLKGEFDPKA